MPSYKHLNRLMQGVKDWNQWRTMEFDLQPDLRNVNVVGWDLDGANFSRTNLNGARLSKASFVKASFAGASLNGAILVDANLTGANFNKASLRNSDLTNTILARCNISNVNLDGCVLDNADFALAYLNEAVFANNDLSLVKGLDSVIHRGPSAISIDTLYRSGGNIPAEFLRGCGVPDDFITYFPSLIGAEQAIQFYSCFVSYSHIDEEFAKRLHSRLREEHIRVWFAPEDIRGGAKLEEQIDRAIQIHDKLLIVLSKNSLESEWVMTEICKARKAEIEGNHRKLFPIRLVTYEELRKWKCFDADRGKDLATEVREYFIPDFSNWTDRSSFELAFERLVRDLQSGEASSEVVN
jgi:hypothetical protein